MPISPFNFNWQSLLSRTPKKLPRKIGKIILFVFLILLWSGVLLSGAAAGYVKIYSGRIYPGVYVGNYHIGRMEPSEVRVFAENLNNRLAKEGLDLEAVNKNNQTIKIKINNVLSGDLSGELLRLDGDALARIAVQAGRAGNWWQKLYAPLFLRCFSQHLLAPVKTDYANLSEILKDNLTPLIDAPRDANLKIASLTKFEVVTERSGKLFQYEKIITQIQNNLAALNFAPVHIAPIDFEPMVKTADAQKAAAKIAPVFNYGLLSLNFVDPQTKLRRDWELPANLLFGWVEVVKDENGEPIISLQEEPAKKYLDSLRYEVDKPTQDAKFVMKDGKAQEFQASRNGLALNLDKTFHDLESAFRARNYAPAEAIKTVSLAVDIAEPFVKISQINDLGIEDILGVGISTFKGSHVNRIKNIGIAVKRLNGTIIRPDEEFSALKYAGPFTPENGFLPELVIKGKEIKKEVGGGMCQIGTTLFRMAMNAGMDITERRNHSLVVNYYADPVNGNPGTDATLYEPILDLKFKNDTGHYLLLQTEVDYKKQQLTFTLWGKPDGRQGSYTHPVVSKWIPAGEQQEVISETLKPGEKECQDPYRGAVASFTYTRVTSAGEKIDRIFDSYYRPLPKICMVGKDPNAPVCKEGEECTTESAKTNALSPVTPSAVVPLE